MSEFNPKLERLLRVIDTVNRWTGTINSLLIVIIAAVMLIEVIARYGFNSPTTWSFEISSYLFFVYILFGGGYTLLYNGHVNTDIFYRNFSVKVKARVDVLTSLLFFIFVVALLWQGTIYALAATQDNQHSGTPWNPPIYPFIWALPLGALLLLMQGVGKFARDLVIALSREGENK
jgi:TRAP-type mannitol/chloroaromatic compound transport system permease small subunit